MNDPKKHVTTFLQNSHHYPRRFQYQGNHPRGTSSPLTRKLPLTTPPMPNTALGNPHHTRQQHQRRRRPRHPQKNLPFVRRNPNIIPVLVNLIHCLDRNRRRDRACDPQRQERCNVEDEVHKGGQAARGQYAPDGAEESDTGEKDPNDVEDEHDFASDFDGADAVGEGFRPVQVGEVEAGFEFGLNDGGGVEVEEGGAVGAFGDVFVGVVGGDVRGVEALAVVHYVRGVEVMDANCKSLISNVSGIAGGYLNRRSWWRGLIVAVYASLYCPTGSRGPSG